MLKLNINTKKFKKLRLEAEKAALKRLRNRKGRYQFNETDNSSAREIIRDMTVPHTSIHY